MQEHSGKVRLSDSKSTRSFFERLTAIISPEPENRAQLLEMLQHAQERNLIDAEALSMIEGVFQVSDLCAGDIMVSRAQMDVIDISQPIEVWLPIVLETAHSRFPAIDGDREQIVGILLAKDLLRHYEDESFDVRTMLRPVIYIPESKRLNVLLRDFQVSRNHMAMVVDEYGGVAGLVTIEDVLEQIVGDIDDEYDFLEVNNNILKLESNASKSRWQVKGLTTLDELFEATQIQLPAIDVETIGGYVAAHLCHVPQQGEMFEVDSVRIEVLVADERQVHLLLIERTESSN